MNYAVVTPMANEEEGFGEFIKIVKEVLNENKGGKMYLVVDTASKDKTLELCRNLSKKDKRFVTVWAPENKNVVDAYIKGYKTAIKNKHDYIIEMDAGLSHNPRELPIFLGYLAAGFEGVWGSRFMKGSKLEKESKKRWLLSRGGTVLANILLGTKGTDMTSGYQGFTREVANKLVKYPLLSRAHFYQTEVRYLLRNCNWIEVPISYKSPSPRVSNKSIRNAWETLWHYFILRLQGKAAIIA